ncbi:MAG: hypothetical protein JKX97_00725, partial [Candidatus Lindowbacteria bacterium]|nr:hypothetical protein [Candidatus Lindowbacteria bacterium]
FGALSALIGPDLMGGIQIKGRGGMDVALTGKTSKPSVQGKLRIDQMDLTLQEPATYISEVVGSLVFTGQNIEITNIKGYLGKSPLTAAGSYNIAKNRMSIDVTAKHLDLATLPKELGFEELPTTGKVDFKGRITGQIESPIVRGEVSSSKFSAYDVEITDFSSGIRYDGKSLGLKSLKATVYEGSIAGDAEIYVEDKSMPFDAVVNVRAISLSQAVQSLSASPTSNQEL